MTTSLAAPRPGLALLSRRPAAKSRIRVVPPKFHIDGAPAAAVFRVAANQGPIGRDDASRATGSSIATVNRQVAALLAAGLLIERHDLTSPGAIGRPRVPIEVNHEPFLTVGIHIGAKVTSIVAADLRGRLLGGAEIATPRTGQELALAGIARSAKAFASRWRRKPLWAGVTVGGRVDAPLGLADHTQLGWKNARAGSTISDALGVPVSVATHVEAMAAAELLLAPSAAPADGSALYFYARETTGAAVTLNGRVHTPNNGPGTIAHFPTGSDAVCECGHRGCLDATVSDKALLEKAFQQRVITGHEPGDGIVVLYRAASEGSAPAQHLLSERAVILGQTAARLRDLFNPDRVILGGQAFTGYPPVLPEVSTAFAATSALPGKDIRITGFTGRVQQYAAAATSLSVIYADPLAAS